MMRGHGEMLITGYFIGWQSQLIATDCNWLKLKSFLVESWIGCQCFANLAAVDWFAQVSYRSRGPKWTVHVQLSHLTIVLRITRCLRRTHVTRRSTASMIDAILQSTASNSSSEFKIFFFFLCHVVVSNKCLRTNCYIWNEHLNWILWQGCRFSLRKIVLWFYTTVYDRETFLSCVSSLNSIVLSNGIKLGI